MKANELKFDPTDKIVVIIGLAASGKTTLTEMIAADLLPDHDVIHTDDYMKFGFEQSLYKMIDDIKQKGDNPMIIEGVQGFRLLRKGLERGDFFPDVVINTTCPTATRDKRYEFRGGTGNLATFDKVLMKIWMDYRDALVATNKNLVKRPRFINIETE